MTWSAFSTGCSARSPHPSASFRPVGRQPMPTPTRQDRPRPPKKMRSRQRSQQGPSRGGTSAWGWVSRLCIRASGSIFERPGHFSGQSCPNWRSPTFRSPMRRTWVEAYRASFRLRSKQTRRAPCLGPNLNEQAADGSSRRTAAGRLPTQRKRPRHPAGCSRHSPGTSSSTSTPTSTLLTSIGRPSCGGHWPGRLRTSTNAPSSRPSASWWPRSTTVMAASAGRARRTGRSFPPFAWDWVADQLVITGIAAQEAGGLKLGDVVVQIDGKPICGRRGRVRGRDLRRDGSVAARTSAGIDRRSVPATQRSF